MPQSPNPQTRFFYKQPIPCRIEVWRPCHRKTGPSMYVRESSGTHHDQNSMPRAFKMTSPRPKHPDLESRMMFHQKSRLGWRPSFKVVSPILQNPNPAMIQVYKQPIPCRIDVEKPCYGKAVPTNNKIELLRANLDCGSRGGNTNSIAPRSKSSNTPVRKQPIPSRVGV